VWFKRIYKNAGKKKKKKKKLLGKKAGKKTNQTLKKV